MPRPLRLLCVALAALAGVAVLPAYASAKKRVVVMPFGGRGASSARAGFISAIRGRFRVISPSGAQLRGGLRNVCRRLRCAAIVRGSVTGRRRRYRVVVSIHDAQGRSLGRRASTVRGRRRLRRAGAAIGRRSVALLGRGRATAARQAPRPAPAPTPPPAPAPAPAQPVATTPPPTPAANQPLMAAGEPRVPTKKKRRRRRSGDDDLDDLEDDSKEVDAPDTTGPTQGGRGLVEVFLAFGMASRTYELLDNQGGKLGRYRGLFYPELGLGVELYPLTLASSGWWSGFGLGASYSRHLSISTEVKDTGESVDTSTQAIQVNLRYRWLIGNRLQGPRVYGFAGWAYRSFDLAPNTILASFGYQLLHVGVGGRLPLGTPYIGLSLEASVRPVLKVGQEAVDAYGARGGALGWSVRPGLYGHLWKLRYFADFELVKYSMDFEGLESADPSQLIAITQPSDGSDTFLRVWIGLGFAY